MNKHQLLLDHVKQALQGHNKVLLALSGGVDSIVLLHLLVTLRQQHDFVLRAIYINHGLSQRALEWGEHCRNVCRQWQVPFELVSVNVNAQQSGLEGGARLARYQVFKQKLTENEVLLTAQHLDDQCETFMLALKRGSGSAGLSAMAQNQPFANTRQIRPLLNVSRRQIEDYANDSALQWVNDESNEDDRFDRNFLRLRVLPIIQRRWPNFSRAVARSAELCAEQEQLLDELLMPHLQNAMSADGSLSISSLEAMSDVMRQAIIRRWFAHQNCFMPSRLQLLHLWQQIALARDDAEPQLKLGNKIVRRFKKRLYLTDEMQDITDVSLSWNGKMDLSLPDNLGKLFLTDCANCAAHTIRAPQVNELVSVRFAAAGDFYVQGRNYSRSIKKLWQEFNIPSWQRKRIPLIYFNDTLIAAVGVFTTHAGQVIEREPRWSIIWQKKN